MAILPMLAISTPMPQSQGTPGTPYDCHCSARKSQLVSLGATALDIAIAFQET